MSSVVDQSVALTRLYGIPGETAQGCLFKVLRVFGVGTAGQVQVPTQNLCVSLLKGGGDSGMWITFTC